MEAPTPTPTATPIPTAATDASASVQQVTKKSSDELLRKFADSGEDEGEAPAKTRVSKRRRKSRGNGDEDQCESPSNGKTSSLVERRLLLPGGSNKNKALLRKIGIRGSRASHLGARDIRNKSLLGAIHKTWRRTIEGASKVFMEKHYNRHKRLISDIA